MAESGPKLAQALSEAEAIIGAAEKRAEEIKLEAQAELERAREKGYQEGVEQGRLDAVETAVRLLEDGGAIGESLAGEAAKLAIAISSTVIGEQVSITPEVVKNIAVKALQESIIGESAVLVVHPDDKSTLEESYNELRRVAGGVGIAIEDDKSISRGGCVVRTEFGEVDAQIDVLLDTIAARLGVRRDDSSS